MFGVLTDDEGWSRQRVNRIASRSFRDVDWAAMAATSAQLTAGVITAVSQATRGNTSNQYPGATYGCPQGYIWNPTTAACQSVQPSGGSFLSNIDPTTLLVGGGLLALVLLSGRG